jgi:hypothetical protein
MTISGESFNVSAWHCYLLNLKHSQNFSSSHSIAVIFMVFAKFCITFINCLSFYIIQSRFTQVSEQISSIYIPLLVTAVMTYMIASIFLGLFDKSI